jgi:release factor glutamine methyltransferase
MTTPEPDAPLFVRLELTPEQQRRIREQTGHSITAIPIEATEPSVRCRFGGLDLGVPRGVFVPTAASERTFELARRVAMRSSPPTRRRQVIIDVGTGVGAIALAIARAFPQSLVYGTEVSSPALRAARRNRARLGLRNVRFAFGSLLSALPASLGGGVDVIVANVPYLPPDRFAEVARVFPEGTAKGTGADGLGLMRELARAARVFLRPGGCLVVQLADFQWPAVAIETARLGYDAPQLASRQGPGPVAACLSWPGSGANPASPRAHESR